MATTSTIHTPQQHKGVMVSSTFQDLEKHRQALMHALRRESIYDEGMENYSPIPDDDIISSSLRMVAQGSAYIGVISQRYGQVLDDDRNPNGYSVTRLEYEEARRLGRPTLMFIMSDKHEGTRADFETDALKLVKLEEFRSRVKENGRLCVHFDSLEDFKERAPNAAASVRRFLEEKARTATQEAPAPVLIPTQPTKVVPLPQPPALRAEPPYIGSHKFVGREAELNTLSDWAAPADTHPILLFEAIGGTGKSMLTWEWTNHHATIARPEWAGRFWYSFYEQGAIMADFCQRALAYMTGEPLDNLRMKKTTELGPLLLAQLTARPWLLVLDGLERVLVAYHRSDAAQLADEEAGKTDQIANRDTCAAIRPEDDELLRSLAGAAPSKLLFTTRLVPRCLLNPSGQAIPGVKRVSLPGLRPLDAEELFRACGTQVRGDSARIQGYLQRECDCHPLTTGVLAGLVVNDYLPDRGNFDAWVDDPAGGGKLNLAQLDLTQKRNHILRTAIEAAPEPSRQLLATLALISEAVDYPLLSALNPHLLPEPEEVEKPENPQDKWVWKYLPSEEKQKAQEAYEQKCQDYPAQLATYQSSHQDWQKVANNAPASLQKTVRDLESRGLVQYDHQNSHYDLHPVVRGVAAGDLPVDEKNRYGQRIVDYFSKQAHRPYEEAETMADVSGGIHLMRTLLQMKRYESAFEVYAKDLGSALFINLQADVETLALLRPFFPQGWLTSPNELPREAQKFLIKGIAVILSNIKENEKAAAVFANSIRIGIQEPDWITVQLNINDIGLCFFEQGHLAKALRCSYLAVDLAELLEELNLFRALLHHYHYLSILGKVLEADTTWQLLDPMGRNWPRNVYRPGEAEYYQLQFHFQHDDLQEKQLYRVEQLAKDGKNRKTIRRLHSLRGEWKLTQGHWQLAADSFHEAVRMAHETGQADEGAEARYALAKFQLGQVPEARLEAERLAHTRQPPHYALAELWRAIGEPEQARKHALVAYKEAWADGEPYVYRYNLNKASTLLQELGATVPDLPAYEPAKEEKFLWEDDIRAAIEQLKAERAAQQAEAEEGEEETA